MRLLSINCFMFVSLGLVSWLVTPTSCGLVRRWIEGDDGEQLDTKSNLTESTTTTTTTTTIGPTIDILDSIDLSDDYTETTTKQPSTDEDENENENEANEKGSSRFASGGTIIQQGPPKWVAQTRLRDPKYVNASHQSGVLGGISLVLNHTTKHFLTDKESFNAAKNNFRSTYADCNYDGIAKLMPQSPQIGGNLDARIHKNTDFGSKFNDPWVDLKSNHAHDHPFDHYITQQIGDPNHTWDAVSAPLQHNQHASKPQKCELQTYSSKPNSPPKVPLGPRELMWSKIIVDINWEACKNSKCPITAEDGQICPGLIDRGAPIICRDKVTLVLDGFFGSECRKDATATLVAHVVDHAKKNVPGIFARK